MKDTLLYLWQLPQNLLGLLFLLFIRGEKKHYLSGVRFYTAPQFKGGISLGQYIIMGGESEKTVRHEYGHCLQSKILGPLYLIVVGLPSVIHAWLCDCHTHSYYDFFCEKWADKLGNVKRHGKD